MKKEKFSFYRDWQKSLKDLPDSQKLELYNAIVDYGLDGVESAVSPIVSMAMNFIKSQIDRNDQKIMQRNEQLRANGKLGGRPLKKQKVSEKPNGLCENQENQKVSEKPNGLCENQENQKVSEKPIINNININDNIDTIKEDKSSSSSEDDAELESCITWKDESIDIPKFIDFWNTSVQGTVIPSIKLIEGERRSKLNARLKQYGKRTLFEAIEKVSKSDFLKGYTSDKGWHATFDWFVTPRNFAKVIEGNYDNKPQGGLYGSEHSKNSRTVLQEKQARQADALARINRLIGESDMEIERRQKEVSDELQPSNTEGGMF